jgi:hypothetical protein
MDVLRTSFPEITDMTVVDLGGTVDWWLRSPLRPAHVTVVNLTEPGTTDQAWLSPVLGDACAAQEALAKAGANQHYDLVFSNSLIEHVGGHAMRVRLAEQVHDLAPHHWVQTPYRYFPLEPHWLFPLMQFLPISAKAAVARTWPLVHTRPGSSAAASSSVQWTELISITEMRGYFPHSTIVKERLLGMTKSITAARLPISEAARRRAA